LSNNFTKANPCCVLIVNETFQKVIIKNEKIKFLSVTLSLKRRF
jgi:hypothetical protein